MKIGIVTPTYRKLDGSTHKHLKEALESVKNQTHKDYKLFLIGDDYDDNDELMELSKIIDKDKIVVNNLPIAMERELYSGMDLWRTGGVNASNVGIKIGLEEGFDYICHLDHDDMFFEDHLELISNCIEITNKNFISTKCGKYPPIFKNDFYIKYRPEANKLFKVTTCVNYRYFNMFFRNMLKEFGVSYAADADLWNRINKFLKDNNEYGILINKITAKRNGGGDTRLRPDIIK